MLRNRTANGRALLTAAVLVVAASTTDVVAATLRNNDAKTYKVDVIVKSSRRQHELAPGKTLADFCAEGCIIRLDESAENDYALEGTERVSIEGGVVYYDGEVAKPKDDASNR
jgi:hypothetical protein